MKRISWDLPVFTLPNDKFYDIIDDDDVTGDKIKKGQTPLTEPLPVNNSYFIGKLDNKKLLCYHISDGKYIVVSYNRNTEIIFKDIIGLYNGGININTEPNSNPTVSIINTEGNVEGTVGDDNE